MHNAMLREVRCGVNDLQELLPMYNWEQIDLTKAHAQVRARNFMRHKLGKTTAAQCGLLINLKSPISA